MTVVIAVVSLVVICAGCALGVWVFRKAGQANREIYEIRRRERQRERLKSPAVPGQVSAGWIGEHRVSRTVDGSLTGSADHGELGSDSDNEMPRRSASKTNLVRAVVLAYVALLAAGFIAGYFSVTGSYAKHLGFGVVGLFGAGVVVAVVVTIVRVGLAVRTAWRSRSD